MYVISLSITFHVGPMDLQKCFTSLPQDKLVTGAISSAVCKHPSLKELTTGRKCPPSLVNGAVEGIVRKEGVKKLVVGKGFPGEL